MIARPSIVRTLVALCTVAGVAPTAASADQCAGADAHPNRTTLRAHRTTIECLINAERRQRGIPPLSHSHQLTRSAGAHSHEMIRNGYFDHERVGGPSFVDRVRGSGYMSGSSGSWEIGEDLARGAGEAATPRAIVAAWMDSSEHREKILRSNFKQIGVGVARGFPDASNRPIRGQLADAVVATADFGRRG